MRGRTSVHTVDRRAIPSLWTAKPSPTAEHDDAESISSHPMRQRFALTVFGAWTTLGFLSIAQTALFLADRGMAVPWRALVPERLLDWYTCAIFTPVFFWLARRYPFDGTRWRSALPITLLVSVTCVVLKYMLFVPLERYLLGDTQASLAGALASNFFIELMIFWAVIGIVHAYEVSRCLQERDRLAAELRTRLTEARLEALQGQLRPHFLFNTLNGISTLVHTDPDAADRTVVQLAELLRASLEHSGTQEIPLSEELTLLERYLGIMQMRFHDRLHVEMSIDAEARDALVPHFILQPLVENALEHGIARRAGAGRVRITARAEPDAKSLHLAIADDGAGPRPARAELPAAVNEGIGLANTRLRLKQLYGSEQQLILERGQLGGMEVKILIPFRLASRGNAVSVA
jgi:two-component system, LytTR family, sensor kinase